MPDKDRLRERFGDDSSSGSSSSSEQSKTKPKKSRDRVDTEERETYGDKIEQFKGSSGGGSKKVKRTEFGKVLEAMANILLHTDGKCRVYGDTSTKKERVKTNVWVTIYEQFTEFMSEGNVQNICEYYGIDWQDDVMNPVLENQDFEGGVENISDVSKSSVNVGRGEKVKRGHFIDILKVLGYMLMFSKTVEKKYSGEKNPEEKLAYAAAKDVSANIIDFLGTFNVVEVAKDNGIHWEHDIISSISEG